MRRAVAVLTLSLAAFAMSAVAADQGRNSLDPVKGRFHKQHTQKLKMDCGTCHASEQRDVLFMRNDRPLPAGMPGPVDRHVCLSCHDKSSKAAWYGRSSK
jgi:cytochrome c553